jgi:hypothetical protein
MHQIDPGELAKVIKKANVIFVTTNRAESRALNIRKMSSSGDEE